MNQNSSNKERVLSLCVGLAYLWGGLGAGKSFTVGFYIIVYLTVCLWLIWYPAQISRVPIRYRRFQTSFRIPPIYIRYLGWVMLLGPMAVTLMYLPFYKP